MFVLWLLFAAASFVSAAIMHIPFVNVGEVRSTSGRNRVKVVDSSTVAAGVACPNVKSFYVPNVAQRPEIQPMLQQFDALLNLIFAQSQAAFGATAMHAQIVFYNQTLYSKGFGVRRFDITPTSPPDENTIFRIGSVSKLFAALMTFIANDRGIIHSLDDPVSDYVPQFAIPPPYPLTGTKNGAAKAGKITFRQLLSQMSGLTREAPCEMVPCDVTTDDILQRLASMPQIVMPDTVPKYSNLAFGVLGRLVPERVIGNTTFDEMLLASILKPLRMSRTGNNVTSVINGDYGDNVCLSYLPNTNPPQVNPEIGIDLGWVSPAGNLFSTPADLNRLMQEYIAGWNLEGKLFLNKDLYRQMFQTAYVDADMQSGFALPFEMLYYNSTSIARKGGNVPGYSTLVVVAHQLGIGISFLINVGQFPELETAGNDVVETVIAAFVQLFTNISPPLPPQPPSSLNAYTGTYQWYSRNMPIAGKYANVTVDAASGMLVIANSAVPITVNAKWLYNDTFSIVAAPPTFTCMLIDAIALEGTIVNFYRDQMTGNVNSFFMPGFVWAVQYQQ